MHKIIMTDGTRTQTIYRVKNVDPWADDVPGVWEPDYTDGSDRENAQSAKLIPSVLAGLNARAQAMSDLPFTIYSVKGDKPLDDSDNYKNVIAWLPNPAQFLSLTEAALVCYGRAYWYKLAKGAKTGALKEVRYWHPDSVSPVIDQNNGLTGFERNPGSGVKTFPADAVLYMWLTDPEVEVGAPSVWPLQSALVAAEASGAITGWVRDYMRRGAIKAMMLSIEGVMPPEDEVKRIESWFGRFMTGVRGLTWKVFNGGTIKPVIVGDGLEALRDLSINSELRYEIHTALGTRHLLEDENYATANARERQFYTQVIVPDARLIQQALNEQVLHPAGFHLEFEPERLECFQADESDRAASLAQLFGVLSQALPVDVALTMSMQILGYDLDAETQALMQQALLERKQQAEENRQARLQAQAAQAQAQAAQQGTQQPTDGTQPGADMQSGQGVPPETVRALVELDKWQAKCERAGKVVTWHAVDLSPELVSAIKAGVMTWQQARDELLWQADAKAAVGALSRVVDMLEERPHA